eukprot:TRINITY_DN40939_c0_g1_i2.p1 TRINITY_DN40939_c0_g1~~TRINITY_DN40939_c0_g1_i2.p1  ORF type:complete len:490 (+),score=139.70 TRINITY_DN40939_c0_g1_i2:94-1563(+)
MSQVKAREGFDKPAAYSREIGRTAGEDSITPLAALSSTDDSSEETVYYPNTWRGRLREFVDSRLFQLGTTAVILLNTMTIAIQCDYPHFPLPPGCEIGSAGCHNLWPWINNCFFLVFFVVELAVRMIAMGCQGFWCDARHGGSGDWSWNWFDFIVVSLAVGDFLQTVLIGGQQSKLITVVRTVRILRILRVMKLFRTLPQLRLLITGLVESFAIVFWILMLNVILLFVCSIFCTQVIGQNAELWGEDMDEIRMYWGSVAASMFTLFQIMTMDNWAYLREQVNSVFPYMEIFFVFFIIFAAFVILSLLTGVMADHMDQVRIAEEEDEKRHDHEDLEITMHELKTEIMKAHKRKNPRISKEEFLGMASNDKLQAQLKRLDPKWRFAASEAPELFDTFDRTGSGFITMDQMMGGFAELRSDLGPRHIMELQRTANKALRFAKEAKANNSDPLGRRTAMAESEDRMDKLEQKVDAFQERLHSLMARYSAKVKC